MASDLGNYLDPGVADSSAQLDYDAPVSPASADIDHDAKPDSEDSEVSQDDWDDENIKTELEIRILQGSCRLVKPDVGGTELKASLWSNLPEEIMERIVAMLPVNSRSTFRLVSKDWRNRIQSSRLVQLSAAVRPISLCTIRFNYGSLWGLQPSLLTGLSELQGLPRLEVSLDLPAKFRIFSPFQCVVQDGLICIYKDDEAGWVRPCQLRQVKRGVDLCVVNPVTRRWIELPREFGHGEYDRDVHRTLNLVSQAGGHFKVIVLTHRAVHPRSTPGSFAPSATFFSSYTGAWKVVHLHDSCFKLEKQPPFVVSRGLLYITLPCCMDEVLVTKVYNLQDGKLLGSQVSSSAIKPEDGESVKLDGFFKMYEHDGQVFCVSRAVGVSGSQVEYSVYRLHLSTLMWQRVSLFPEHLQQELLDLALSSHLGEDPWKKLDYLLVDGIEGTVAGDCICLTIRLLRSDRRYSSHLIKYNILQESWSLDPLGLVAESVRSTYSIFAPNFDVLSK